MGGFLEDVKRQFKKFKEMSTEEKAANLKVLVSNPNNYKVLTESADLALAWSRELATTAAGPANGADFDNRFKAAIRGGPADAARHCFWSARLASKLGYNDAAALVSTHEMTGLQDTTAGDPVRLVMESTMDLTNNAVGLKIGVRMANMADDSLKQACLDALKAGELREIDRTGLRLVPTTSIVP
jgi:hypothetical protein